MRLLNYYPQDVCFKCGMEASPDEEMENLRAVWRLGVCDMCRETRVVTNPENFGNPEFKGYKP